MVLDFETFRIDFDSRRLFRGEEEVHLSKKAFQLLQVLIESRPKALSKADIHEQLWPATFVADSSLASVVNEVRKVLADDAHVPRYIRTVHAFGYAFCAEPVVTAGPSQRAPVSRLIWEGGEAVLFEGRNIIGRDPDAAVRVDDRTISRHHAALVVRQGTATIEDLQSKNGTYRDGVRVNGAVALSDGAVVEVGSVRMIYREISNLSTTTLYRR